MNTFKGLAFIILSTLALVSCDPCSGVVCNNGTCNNGTCVCEAGYEKNNSSCIAVNKTYIGTGSVTAKLVSVDNNGNSNTTNNLVYTLTASSTNPYIFTLVGFNGLTKNDISFEVSASNYDVLIAGNTTTGAGNTYDYSGAKVGNQIQLTIKETKNLVTTTYTISYVA